VSDDIELDGEDVRIGMSADTPERIALRLIGRVRPEGFTQRQGQTVYGLDKVCERITSPLPAGCWQYGDRSPYALYGDQRWCDACIAYAALNGTLPSPALMIEGAVA
jgi:hypothetical protein